MSRLERTQKWVSVLLTIIMMVSFMQPFSFALGEGLAHGSAIQSTEASGTATESSGSDAVAPLTGDATEVGAPSELSEESSGEGDSVLNLSEMSRSGELIQPLGRDDDDDDDEGEITVGKVLKDANGVILSDHRTFNITLTGPSYPSGKAYTITSGSSFEVKDLKYGTYTVVEANTGDYSISYFGSGKLDKYHKKGTITIINTEKALGKVTISKELKDAEGATLSDSRMFNVTLTGPSYPSGMAYNITSGSSLEVEGLIYGSYTVAEANTSDYTVAISAPVLLNIGHKTGRVTITNTEKALGKVTISKELKDAKGTTLGDSRMFNVTLTGPSYPSGMAYNITSGSSLEVEGLIYGSYTVAEASTGDYTVTTTGAAVLSAAHKTGTITITNTEKALGKLTITKVVENTACIVITEPRTFDIIVTGPSYMLGHAVEIASGTPVVLDGLIYGEYTITEVDAEGYSVAISDAPTLCIDEKEGSITITNTEKPLGRLTINARVFNASGMPVAPGMPVQAMVYGPSFPMGKMLSLVTGTPLVLENLAYGTYRLEAEPIEGYTISLGDPVFICIENREGTLEVVERQGFGQAGPTLTRVIPASAQTGDSSSTLPLVAFMMLGLFGLWFGLRRSIRTSTGKDHRENDSHIM